MRADSQTMKYDAQASETAEELIGVLTAISVITKRMAKKLTAMECRRTMAGGEKANGNPSERTPHAD